MFTVSVVAHVDHGKTTLLDSILSYTRIISHLSAGKLRYLDSRIDEQERGITLKLSFFQANEYVFIDTPGHIDFESLIECSSFLCDFFIFIVDVNEGITPRTLSLLNWMKNKKCILVLNKIDKLIHDLNVYSKTIQIIESMNAFFNDEYFIWEENNIVIASSLLLFGINYNSFQSIKEKNTIKDVLVFIYLKLIDNSITKKRREKLKTLLQSKNIGNDGIEYLFSLSDIVLNSLSCLHKFITLQFFMDEKIRIKNYLIDTNNDNLADYNKKIIYGISTYAIRYDGKLYFIARLLESISEGIFVFCVDNQKSKKIQIKKIYNFMNDKLHHIQNGKQGSLVAIEGDFTRNFILTSFSSKLEKELLEIKPFYTKIVKMTDEIKKKIKELSFYEPILRAKIDKFGQIQLFCEGKMHFEKIECDLEYSIDNVELHDVVYESCGNKMEQYVNEEELSYQIKIEKSRIEQNEIYIGFNESEYMNSTIKDKNEKLKNLQNYKNEITNAIKIFIKKGGTLFNEKVLFTKFTIHITKHNTTDNLLNHFLKKLRNLYQRTNPIPILFYYSICLSVVEQLVGRCYKLLDKFEYKLIKNEYDGQNKIFKIQFMLRRNFFNDFHDELKNVSKGLFSIFVQEKGFFRFEGEWNKFIEKEKRRRGLYEDEIIVKEPEKQRTYKKR